MIIDLPPQTEQAIIATAEAQGLTVAELLKQTFVEPENFDFIEHDGIVSHGNHTLSPEVFQAIYDDLDQEPQPNPRLQALMAKYGGLNV